jgi:hypothetical protein
MRLGIEQLSIENSFSIPKDYQDFYTQLAWMHSQEWMLLALIASGLIRALDTFLTANENVLSCGSHEECESIMSVQIIRRHFNITEYYRMAAVGVLSFA